MRNKSEIEIRSRKICHLIGPIPSKLCVTNIIVIVLIIIMSIIIFYLIKIDDKNLLYWLFYSA